MGARILFYFYQLGEKLQEKNEKETFSCNCEE